jgi:hypothetical protein
VRKPIGSMKDIFSLKLYTRVARLGSFSAAAREADCNNSTVASPDYLTQHGMPATPSDLAQHRIVGGTAVAVPTAWIFEREGRESAMQLEPQKRSMASDLLESEGCFALRVDMCWAS